jgi:predicted RNase H-like HicB family nuclease
LSGTSDANIAFGELSNIRKGLGFESRTKSSHHIFRKEGVEEKINPQKEGAKAKPYQVRQVRNVRVKYELTEGIIMFKYETIIYWSEEDQVYLAEVPELFECVAHGDNYETALSNIKDAIQLWIDTAYELGDSIPVPKGRKLMYA